MIFSVARGRAGVSRLTRCWLSLPVLLALTVWVSAADKHAGTGTVQSSHLYTEPDPSAGGGIRGRLEAPTAVAVFALPVDDWRLVYRGTMESDGRSFAFTGLPVGRYDLVVLCSNAVYEGITLSRSDSTLEEADLKAIEDAVMKSTPFFDTKRILRTAGAGGDEGKARALIQEVRTRPVTLQSAEVRNDIQVRSLKLVLTERAGRPGWALVHTREIVRQEVTEGQAKGLLAHRYAPPLGGIRVVDSVKDVGAISVP